MLPPPNEAPPRLPLPNEEPPELRPLPNDELPVLRPPPKLLPPPKELLPLLRPGATREGADQLLPDPVEGVPTLGDVLRLLPNDVDGLRPVPKLVPDCELPLPLSPRPGVKVLRGVPVTEPERPLPNDEPPTVLRVLLSREPNVPLLRGADGRRPVPNDELPLLRGALPNEPPPRWAVPNEPPVFMSGTRLAVPNWVRLLGLPLKPCPKSPRRNSSRMPKWLSRGGHMRRSRYHERPPFMCQEWPPRYSTYTVGRPKKK